MNWILNKTRWELIDETKEDWDSKVVGFVDLNSGFPDVNDAYQASKKKSGKGHGPNWLGRFKLDEAKAAVEKAVRK